jgi:hypothetical protein
MPFSAAAQVLERPNSNRFLLALPVRDYGVLAKHLRWVTFDSGSVLHRADSDIEHIYFPDTGMVSIVVIMQDGTMVEAATVGRAGVVNANAALVHSMLSAQP